MTSLPPAPRSFLHLTVPRNVRWWHTLGALLLVYLVLQALTGFLLATYYNPSPENAYASLGYVREELFLGAFVQALHQQGAGFVLVVAVAFLLHTFFTAAYKGGRASLWWIALLGFGLLTVFPFTGMLLPFDQKGYWATVIGLDVAGSAPGIGGTVRDLLTGGGDATSPIALSRFYILHVAVLPLTLVAMAALYLRRLRAVGPAGPTNGESGPPTPFFPTQTARIVVVALVGVAVLALAAMNAEEGVRSPADPSDDSFFPYPEWYFLPHYQVLRMLPGSLQWLGTVYVPVFFLLLLALPLVDRGPERRFGARKLLNAGAILVLAGTLFLGTSAWLHVEAARTDRPRTALGQVAAGAEGDEAELATLRAGRQAYQDFLCATCHILHGEGEAFGPELTGLSRRVRPDFLEPFLRNPSDYFHEAAMVPWDGTNQELADLIAFLLSP